VIAGVVAGAVYGNCVGNALKPFPDRRGLAANALQKRTATATTMRKAPYRGRDPVADRASLPISCVDRPRSPGLQLSSGGRHRG
jgi:hypothetical protein